MKILFYLTIHVNIRLGLKVEIAKSHFRDPVTGLSLKISNGRDPAGLIPLIPESR